MKTWTLRGTTTSYVVGIPDHGQWAQLVAWGPYAVADGPYTVAVGGTEHFVPRADVEPLEYAVRGVRYTAPVELVVSAPDGSDELRPIFTEAIVSRHPDSVSAEEAALVEGGEELQVAFVDKRSGVRLVLHYRMVRDVLERWVSLRNDGPEALTLHRHDSAAFVVPMRPSAIAAQARREASLSGVDGGCAVPPPRSFRPGRRSGTCGVNGTASSSRLR